MKCSKIFEDCDWVQANLKQSCSNWLASRGGSNRTRLNARNESPKLTPALFLSYSQSAKMSFSEKAPTKMYGKERPDLKCKT
jgi:hypothetical protein